MKKYKVYADLSVDRWNAIYRFIKDAEKEGITEDEACNLLDDFTTSFIEKSEDLEQIIRSYIMEVYKLEGIKDNLDFYGIIFLIQLD